jgi:hypothetical protein
MSNVNSSSPDPFPPAYLNAQLHWILEPGQCHHGRGADLRSVRSFIRVHCYSAPNILSAQRNARNVPRGNQKREAESGFSISAREGGGHGKTNGRDLASANVPDSDGENLRLKQGLTFNHDLDGPGLTRLKQVLFTWLVERLKRGLRCGVNGLIKNFLGTWLSDDSISSEPKALVFAHAFKPEPACTGVQSC